MENMHLDEWTREELEAGYKRKVGYAYELEQFLHRIRRAHDVIFEKLTYWDEFGNGHCSYCGATANARCMIAHKDHCPLHDVAKVMATDPSED